MRASRLLSILILLQLRGRLSAAALAREFEVSVRTIHRDVDELSAAGVPIYAERGRAGGFALHEGYRTRLTGLTPAEAEALLLAGVGDAARDLGVGAAAAAAQLKLLASLPTDAGASAQRVARRFHLDPVAWYGRAESLDILPALARAVWNDRAIRIRYESWKDIVSRDVSPLGLVLKGGAWYLVGVVDGRVRTYRVSSIRDLVVLERAARRPRGFDLARYWTTSARAFEARLLSGSATLRISPAGRRLMRDVSAAASEAVEASASAADADGWVTATVPVEAPDYAARQFLRLGADVEVLAPPALREAVAAQAAQVAALYRRKTKAPLARRAVRATIRARGERS